MGSRKTWLNKNCLFVLFLLIPMCLMGQSETKQRQLEAYRLSAEFEFKFDGTVSEKFWYQIEPATGFRQKEPSEGAPATEQTEVRIAYDNEYLYMGVILYDSNPERIKAYQKRRDAGLGSDERFMWIFDTFNDQRNAYFFEVNPNGLRGDAILSTGQGSNFNKNWDGLWDVRTSIGDFGWSVEVRIPFQTLNFDPNIDKWGVNFQRTVRRKSEELLWTGHRRSQGLFRPQDAGILTGLSGLSQGLGLEVVPYGIINASEQNLPTSTDSDINPDAGLDVNYSITPSLKASLTFNTDFAETEVDQRQVNLTRFPQFYPEQRDFFLEGANIYSFAPSSGINPYFSRRIGLRDGEPIPITYGARVLGNAGGYNMALLHVRTGEKDSVNPENFSVARVKRNIGSESTVGLIYTRRSTQNSEQFAQPLQDRHTVGADLELGTSTFLGDKNLQFQAFFVYHNPAYVNDDTTNVWDRSSRGIRLNFPNQPWSGHVSYREFGNSFSPAVGFTPRNSFRRLQPSISYNPQLENSYLIQRMGWDIRYEHLTDLDFELLTQDLGFSLFETQFTTGDQISFGVSRHFEQLQRPFDIKSDGSIILAVGKYTTWESSTRLETASQRKISAELNVEYGEFWSGTRTQYGGEITFRPYPGFSFSPEYIRTDVNLAQGSFSTDLLRFEANLDFTTSLFLTMNIQYDNLTDVVGVNNRLRWIIIPGSDLYLVYKHNWLNQMSRFRTTQRKGAVKLTYTHRF